MHCGRLMLSTISAWGKGMPEKKKHLSADKDLYTPVGPEVLGLLNYMRMRHGGTWRQIAYLTDTRLRVHRHVRTDRKAISMTLMDRLITHTGYGSLNDFPWFTADDLVTLGVWKPLDRDS